MELETRVGNQTLALMWNASAFIARQNAYHEKLIFKKVQINAMGYLP